MVTAQKITLRPLCRGVSNCVDGTITLNKFSGQPWYFWGISGFGFFDQEVPDHTKWRMVAAHDKDGDEDPPKRSLRKDFQKTAWLIL